MSLIRKYRLSSCLRKPFVFLLLIFFAASFSFSNEDIPYKKEVYSASVGDAYTTFFILMVCLLILVFASKKLIFNFYKKRAHTKNKNLVTVIEKGSIDIGRGYFLLLVEGKKVLIIEGKSGNFSTLLLDSNSSSIQDKPE